MDRPVLSYTDARNMMVDGQVRPNKVTDQRILDAMRRIPREQFLRPELSALAYVDEDVKLPGGRALVEPMVIARLIQLLALRSGERALVVGAGPGYGAAVVAACGARVVALEEDESLLHTARAVLAEIASEVMIVTGKLTEGWPGAAPYDAILIEGAVEYVPAALGGQLLNPGGRLVTVLADVTSIGRAVIGEPAVEIADRVELSFQPVFDCATPVLPQFRRETGFVF